MRCSYCARRVKHGQRVPGGDTLLDLVEVGNLSPERTDANPPEAFVPDLLAGYVQRYDPSDWLKQPRTVLVRHADVCKAAT